MFRIKLIVLSFIFKLTFISANYQLTDNLHFIDNDSKCEEISVQMCRDIGYNMTRMPNQFFHDTQEEAAQEAHQFWPLVQFDCSDDLKFFLCSMYTPICMDDFKGRLPACRSVCERAKYGCSPIMKIHGFDWPEKMDCNKFPVYGKGKLCMDEKEGAQPIINNPIDIDTPVKSEMYPKYQCKCYCRPPMIPLDPSDRSYNRIETGGILNCAQPCSINRQEQRTASLIITIFSSICLICSILVVFTFMTDTERYKYPERSIIFLSGCYIMVSIGFLLKHFFDNIACDGNRLRYPSTDLKSPSCMIVFLCVYFFGLAASLWWAILTLTWVLAASFKWSTEAITSYSLYYHLIAWFGPTIASFLVVSLGSIDGESLAGICSVGNLDKDNLLYFVIIPQTTLLLVGLLLLCAGFVSLFRIRTIILAQAKSKADKLEKLMVRIIIFSILYIVPLLTFIGISYYEYNNKKAIEKHFICLCDDTWTTEKYLRLYILKYIMNLGIGIGAFFWILSGKTCESWSRFLYKLCCCCCSLSQSSTKATQLRKDVFTSQRTAYNTSSNFIPHNMPLSHV